MNKKYRKPIIAGNWKMNMLASQTKDFADELKPLLPKTRGCESVVCAPYPLIPSLVKAVKGMRVAVGAQDVSVHDKGAYTGEVSAAMLKDLGVKYCIVGHSERRAYHGETDELVNAKTKALLAPEVEITPIICVGETLDQREKGITMEWIAMQVKCALNGLTDAEVRRCVIAYEPVWAIGTGKTATAEQAQEVCEFIRATVRKLYDAKTARALPVLYGGSMNAKNCAELLACPDIDGGLIGGASLKPADFSVIINAACGE
ncbi:MAG: triose-phosphate isomerase [Oscillospiraceae bacterium]|nr:triose-phosphate isomerase [Oscillospiraceae bacterium]